MLITGYVKAEKITRLIQTAGASSVHGILDQTL
jgi:hypothetical protein